jgi:15-cis-phytoene synthase
MPVDLANSYAYCQETARRKAGNFYPAFRLLPRSQRLSMCALYSFFRETDDLADEEAPTALKKQALKSWRGSLAQALQGSYSHPLHPALDHSVKQFGIPPEFLEEVIDGVEMDLDIVRYRTFDDLYPYCYRVASAVGLACIHIWGFSGQDAKKHAEAAGIAFQLTNILRDLKEDAQRGRIYLPQEDLVRFQYGEDELTRGECNDRFRDLMQFEVGRAKEYYDRGRPLVNYLNPPGRAIFMTMARTYRGLLNLIEKNRYDVFSKRLRLPRWRKVGLALQALPIRWGWL